MSRMVIPDNVYERVFYQDDDYYVSWENDETGTESWWVIGGKDQEPGDEIAHVAALATIGKRLLQNCMDEDAYMDLSATRRKV